MSMQLISIIIPTLNEEKTIEDCLKQFNSQSQPFEIIISDGSSTDRTKEIVKLFANVKLVESQKGRGIQMNAGAEAAGGEILLFLHADTLLPKDGLDSMRKTMDGENAIGGYFRLEHKDANFSYKLFSPLINWRSRLPNITPYGDQAIFCSREAFEKIDGYKDLPLMEDYDFAKRLRRQGKLVRIDEKVSVSFRRYQKGIFRYALLCNIIALLYNIGVSPEFLKRLYKEIR
jgi:rSAM/selenodomain-associated transferase 2